MTPRSPLGPDFLRRRIRERGELPSPDERRQIREACDIPVSDLALALGVSAAAVRQWERGERTPQGDGMARYIEALRVMRTEARTN